MGIVRNCIDVIGITSEKELPNKIKGQLIEVSEAENIPIENNINIKNIYQIVIELSKKGNRVIKMPINKIIVIDGYKKLKIAYYDTDNNMGVLEVKIPYNLFFDLNYNKYHIEKTNIYIADAYFELINKKMLYCNILYVVDIQYIGDRRKVQEINTNNIYEKDNTMKNYYTISRGSRVGSDNEVSRNKNESYNEMSISGEDNKFGDDEQQINEVKKNKLIDIDSEYL